MQGGDVGCRCCGWRARCPHEKTRTPASVSLLLNSGVVRQRHVRAHRSCTAAHGMRLFRIVVSSHWVVPMNTPEPVTRERVCTDGRLTGQQCVSSAVGTATERTGRRFFLRNVVRRHNAQLRVQPSCTTTRKHATWCRISLRGRVTVDTSQPGAVVSMQSVCHKAQGGGNGHDGMRESIEGPVCASFGRDVSAGSLG